MKSLDNAEIICYDSDIYEPKTLHIHALYWYHLHLDHPGGGRLANITKQVCYWTGLFTKADLYIDT